VTPSLPRSVVFARALHRALLVLMPRRILRAYRSDMIATFDAASAEAGARGTLHVCRLLLREIVDLATASRANRPSGLTGPALGEPARRHWMQPPAWRQAWRSLVRRPAFLAAAVLTLGFGAGITMAVFALVDTVLIKPLPYPDPDRLVTVYELSPSSREGTSMVAPARLEDWQRLNRTFVALAASYAENVTDTSVAEPERLEGRRVTRRFFAVYAMPFLAGRGFTDDEEQANGPGAVVISERFWQRRFDRDPAAIGRALTIGGRAFQIVGVIPDTFTSAATDVWLPAQMGAGLMRARQARFLHGIGRLRPSVSVDEAARDLASVQESLGREFPATDAGWSAQIRALKEVRVGAAQRGLVLVFCAVASLWIIAVANIAGLTLVQMQRRTRELAIRAALGASRGRVIGTVVREGLLIALLGGALGAALAAWLVTALPAVLTKTPRINELALDWRPFAFAAVTSLAAACAFSLIPALAGTRLPLLSILGGASRGVAGGRHGLQKVLVVFQVALSLLLVGSATLLLRSYYNLTHVETGFDPSSALTFHVAARWDEDRTRVGQLQAQLVERLQQLPHVQAAGLTNFLPATGATLRYYVVVDGLSGPNPDGSMTVGTRMIGDGYLQAIRAPLRAGSWCPPLARDPKAPRQAIVNERFVEMYAHGQDLIGRTLRMTQFRTVPFTIAGVVGNLAEDGHGSSSAPYLYTCEVGGSWPDPEYVVRTSDARAFAIDLRRIVREIDPARAVFGLRPVQDVLDAALDQPRLDTAMLTFFAAAAVMLAAVGLYSLFMLVVSERGREIAVRLAIGAAPWEMIRLVLSDAGRLLAGGIALGIALTAAADRLLRGVLFGVSPLDAAALAAAAATLAVVCVVAVAGPALKAARIAPIDALRGD
jgi:putative ABC transport system permease protein